VPRGRPGPIAGIGEVEPQGAEGEDRLQGPGRRQPLHRVHGPKGALRGGHLEAPSRTARPVAQRAPLPMRAQPAWSRTEAAV